MKSTIKSIFFALIIFSLGAQSQKLVLSQGELKSIGLMAENCQNSIICKGLVEERDFREATRAEVYWLLNHIASSQSTSSRTIAEIKSDVLKRMQADAAIMSELTRVFSILSPLNQEITWSCSTNKMGLIIPEAISVFEKFAEIILQGHLPPEFKNYWDLPRCVGTCEGLIEGHNGRELGLKAALLVTLLELRGDLHLTGESVDSMITSAIVHSTPLPVSAVLNEISKLSFFYNGTLSPVQGELSFVHGGYAFGGQYEDSYYSHLGHYGKRLGPQDCASWISRMLDFPLGMSTFDFAMYYRDVLKVLGKQCPDNDFARYDAVQKLVPAQVASTQDVLPGMILITRQFDVKSDLYMNNTLGTSGHAALVVDVDSVTNSMITLEFTRDLPRREGFGVQRISYFPSSNVRQMFFRLVENAE